jgi:hypothetical protein
MDTNPIISLIKLTIDYTKPSLTLESDWYFVVILILILFTFKLFLIKRLLKWFNWYEMEVEISGSPKITFKVERNNENLYIANRIYIELTTRKAAILFDEENDVIEEVYNSWYKLFGIIRDEIKTVPGKYLKDHDPTSALIGLTTRILNEGLRPHLTNFQARFRKWYSDEKNKPENKDLSPQEIQKKYPDYKNLITSIRQVNRTLIDFSIELNKLVKG